MGGIGVGGGAGEGRGGVGGGLEQYSLICKIYDSSNYGTYSIIWEKSRRSPGSVLHALRKAN
jgi:hypothetical protein